jgi:heme a synthase
LTARAEPHPAIGEPEDGRALGAPGSRRGNPGRGAPCERTLTWAAVVAVFLLMTLGNVVSATGSGLACPDWPLCQGRLIPPLRADVLIEYSHRIMALVASAMLIATIALAVRSTSQPAVRRLGAALLALLAVQILLGGVTVLLELPDLISTAHLVNALLIFAGLLVLAGRASTGGRSTGRSAGAKMRRLIAAGLGVLLLQLALGGYVRHAGAGLACPDFPLCAGSLIPSHTLGIVHGVHRWLGVALLGFFIQLALAARRTPLASIASAVTALAAVQVALGIAAVLLRLDPPVRAAHAAVGYALWGAVVWLSVRADMWRLLLGAPDTDAGLAELARAS